MILSERSMQFLTIANSMTLLLIVVYLFSQNSIPSSTTSSGGTQNTSSSNEPSQAANSVYQPAPQSSGQGSNERPPQGAGATSFGELLEDTVVPLRQASSDHNEVVDLPTDEELAAAIATGSLSSAETTLVLDKLKEGYARYNMPFPTLNIPDPPSQNPPRIPANNTPASDDGKAFEAWLTPTIDRLRTELKQKGEKELGIVPSQQEIEAAIDSNSFQSPETQLVVDMLKNGFARFQIPFPDPSNPGQIEGEEPRAGTAGNSSGGSTSAGQASVSEKQILKAYFNGQLQRLRLESGSKSIDIEAEKPTAKEIDSAVATGSLQSTASQAVIVKIKSCYDKLGLTFYAPPVGK